MQLLLCNFDICTRELLHHCILLRYRRILARHAFAQLVGARKACIGMRLWIALFHLQRPAIDALRAPACGSKYRLCAVIHVMGSLRRQYALSPRRTVATTTQNDYSATGDKTVEIAWRRKRTFPRNKTSTTLYSFACQANLYTVGRKKRAPLGRLVQ